MPLPALLPDSARITLHDVLIDGERITLVAQAIGSPGPCPQCGELPTRVHSRYTRTLADLPWQGRAVRIELEVRRFFCLAPACPRRTFAERLPEVASASARTTARLHAEGLKWAYQALGIHPIPVGGLSGSDPDPYTVGGRPWYDAYVKHAKYNGILFSNDMSPTSRLIREDMVYIVWKLMNSPIYCPGCTG